MGGNIKITKSPSCCCLSGTFCLNISYEPHCYYLPLPTSLYRCRYLEAPLQFRLLTQNLNYLSNMWSLWSLLFFLTVFEFRSLFFSGVFIAIRLRAIFLGLILFFCLQVYHHPKQLMFWLNSYFKNIEYWMSRSLISGL